MRTTSSRAGASAVSGATRPFMRGSIAAATSRPPQPQRSKQRRNSSASLVTASNGPAPDRTWWTFTRGPSCESVPVWAVAGAGWPGRSEGVVPQAHDRARTPPGGDRRPIQAGAGLQDGPLVAGLALEPLDAVVELADVDRELDVEARLLGEDLTVVLAQQAVERPLEPRDRRAVRAGRAQLADVGLDDGPLEQVLERDGVDGVDDEAPELVGVGAPRPGLGSPRPRDLQCLLRRGHDGVTSRVRGSPVGAVRAAVAPAPG